MDIKNVLYSVSIMWTLMPVLGLQPSAFMQQRASECATESVTQIFCKYATTTGRFLAQPQVGCSKFTFFKDSLYLYFRSHINFVILHNSTFVCNCKNYVLNYHSVKLTSQNEFRICDLLHFSTAPYLHGFKDSNLSTVAQ